MLLGFIGAIVNILIANHNFEANSADKGLEIYETNIPLACPHWQDAQSALTNRDYPLALEALEKSEPYESKLLESDPWFETLYDRHTELKEQLPTIIAQEENLSSNIPLGLEITIQSLKYDISELCSSE